MEGKVVLYNSDNLKIGETFTRRARQLVNKQRAVWMDDNQSAIRFYHGMENMDEIITESAVVCNLQSNQLCFAYWSDGYYYPAVIGEVLPSHVKVAFLGFFRKYSKIVIDKKKGWW